MQRDTLPFTDFGVPTHALAMPYLGRVTDVNDPENLARVKVELYALDTDANVALWARVASPFAGAGRGGFFIPQEDDEVLVLFVGGDARHPVVVGGLFTLAALLFMGVPADLANGTNRVSVALQSAEGVRGFHRHGVLDTAAIVPITQAGCQPSPRIAPVASAPPA